MNGFHILSMLLLELQLAPTSPLDQTILRDTFSTSLLERAVIIATNQARGDLGISPVTSHAQLQISATRMSLELAERKTLSHTSINPETRHLEDRLERAGIDMINVTIGENLGVDYLLQIANRYFYIDTSTGASVPVDAETHQPILNFTYRQFGQAMVNHWLESLGHREILLNPKFEWIGIGAVLGEFQGFESIYVTQHFLGRIQPGQ